MAAKGIVIVLLAFFAVQCLTELPSLAEIKAERGLKEDLEKLIAKIVEIAKNAFDGIGEIFQKVIAKLGEDFKKVIEVLDKAFQGVLDKIQELKEEAAQTGKDISDCTDQNLENIKKIHANAKVEAQKCHEDNEAEVKKIFAEAEADFPDVSGEAKKLWDEFLACDGILCRTKVVAKAVAKNAEMTVEIGVIAAKTGARLTGAGATGAYCLSKTSANATKNYFNILGVIVKCVKEHP